MHKELREHVIKLLEKGLRLDGRKSLDYREPIKVTKGIIKTAEGSAHVIVGDTEVIAGVKMEVGEPYPDTPDEGGIIVGAELLPLSNPDFELGPPKIGAIEIARVIDRGIRESKAIDLKALCIEPEKKVWNVIIDICPINDNGNLLDVSALAAISALTDTTFPKYENEKLDYKTKTDKKLPIKELPVAVTVIKVGNKFLVDPDTEEEKVIGARLTISTKEDDIICSLQKGGDTPFTFEDIDNCISIAIKKARELRKCI
ncbi:MAG: exosome complex protein Rrp42 [Nanoarchaeota archaeon]